MIMESFDTCMEVKSAKIIETPTEQDAVMNEYESKGINTTELFSIPRTIYDDNYIIVFAVNNPPYGTVAYWSEDFDGMATKLKQIVGQ